ncbi:DUF4269 domain-containing protein [Dyadobacter sp. CY312]|uniref:DUF4269 domain-containing protein n=1 Tax=Dyadobacter sp. CY312 TaxID=2907303 RepID=UPI001F24D8B3|nr:DUF4269 domain-containing protein [Dyadobacter sp. CY312]MCE7039364.1 DUF4269 domain-containing protein [Dyadobacter sp. CY312]
MTDFTNIEYLKTGNIRQRHAHNLLTKNRILSLLREFDPLLVGTIPIGIDLPDSDLDIVCCAEDKDYFLQKVSKLFGNTKDFRISHRAVHEAVVANFWIDGFELEIFGQNIPTRQQNGYCHMLMEYRLLVELGEEFRNEIVNLKKKGYKTEPAFAKALGLEGDPYEAVLTFDPQDIIRAGWHS